MNEAEKAIYWKEKKKGERKKEKSQGIKTKLK